MSLSFVKQVWKQIEAYTNILCIWTAVSDTVFKIWQGFHHNMPNTTLEFDVWKIYRSHNSTTGAICCLHVIFVSRVSHPFFFFYPTIFLVYLLVESRLALFSLPLIKLFPSWLSCLLPHPHIHYCQFRCEHHMNEWVCLGPVWGPSVTMGPLSVFLLIKFKQDLIDNSSFLLFEPDRKQLSQERKLTGFKMFTTVSFENVKK